MSQMIHPFYPFDSGMIYTYNKSYKNNNIDKYKIVSKQRNITIIWAIKQKQLNTNNSLYLC